MDHAVDQQEQSPAPTEINLGQSFAGLDQSSEPSLPEVDSGAKESNGTQGVI